MSPVRLEVCTDSVAGCRAALAGGAARVELCAGLAEGGTTPSAGLLSQACALGIEVVALIRPRAGDFLYDTDELETMRRDIRAAKAAGAMGVALGVLTVQGDVDRARTAELIELARPLAVVFHRAFDATRAPLEALEVLIELGVERLLSAGGAARAEEGLHALAELVQRARERLSVLPSGGVRPHNAAHIVRASGAREVHASARALRPSPMRHRNRALCLASAPLPGEYERLETEVDLVRALSRALAQEELA
jgi:copper homeostasis protein